jgi:spore maturation protein CgeB
MKLLKITTVYQTYWKKFYAKRPELVKESYAVQKAALDYDGFGWADFWSHALTPLGYEVIEIIANVEPLQKAWVSENKIHLIKKEWLLKIAFEQIKSFQPTVLFLDDYFTFTPDWVTELKQVCPSIQLVISWCGAPYQDEKFFKAHDLVLSCIPEFVEKFRKMGHWSEHINHAFEPRLLKRLLQTEEPEINVSFIGQIVRSSQYHLQRKLILEQLVEKFPVQIYSPNANFGWTDDLKQQLKASAQKTMEMLQTGGIPQSWLMKIPKIGKFATDNEQICIHLSQRLRSSIKPAVFGLEMYHTLQKSKITFNCHIDSSPHSASNMRLFEATGSGACLLTDWKENIDTLFEPDCEVVTYKSTDECIEKVKWLLEHSEERKTIAQAGQNRTLKDHTFAHRAVQLNDLIQKGLRQA